MESERQEMVEGHVPPSSVLFFLEEQALFTLSFTLFLKSLSFPVLYIISKEWDLTISSALASHELKLPGTSLIST